jgi:Mn-dependent DtxR family transcriptional regulator
MNLLYEKGWICDPKSKAKSVVLTDEGERLATRFLEKHFGRHA